MSKDDGAKRKPAKPNLTITVIYRPPSARQTNTELLCQLFENPAENSIIIGDFNFPSIDWATLQTDRQRENFLTGTLNNGYEQIVDFPTHIRGNILDLVFTNRPEKIVHLESLGNLSNSDHSILSVDVLFKPKTNHSSELVRDFKNGDCEGLRNHLNAVPWATELDGLNTEEAWQHLKGKINNSLDLFIPKVPRRNNNRPQWITKTVNRLIRTKQRHYNTYMRTRSEPHKVQFKQTEKLCKKAVRAAKRKFETKIAKHGNKRPFNSYIKSKTKSRDNVGPLKVGDRFITDNNEMATLLNNAFTDVFSIEDLNNVPYCPPRHGNKTIHNVQFTPSAVAKKIKSLKVSPSSGPDGISSSFLRDNVSSMAVPLSIIYTKSMETGTVPSDWRKANVTPIFKKGSKSDPGNYRPISLTSIPCKVMESIMRDEIVDHLVTQQLIKSTQHGFMSHKSCTTNLLEFMENITKNLDEGTPMDVIYLDFSKAFDKVPHKRLLSKVESLGIHGRVAQWIAAWLSDRTQRTVLNGESSGWSEVLSGVPQGSVLGPLLFVIFINDLDDCTNMITTMQKFADDTKLGNVARNQEDCVKMQECINKLLTWAETWNMEFNVKKCKTMHIGRRNPLHQYSMLNTPLQVVNSERDIGIHVSDNLKPSTQCAEAARRANAVLTQISRAFLYRDRRVFLQLYKSFVRCHLEFCIPVWSLWQAGDVEVLERVQRRAVNLIRGLQGTTYEDKLEELGLRSLEDRRTRIDLVQTFKILKGIDDVDPTTWFRTVGNEVTRATRSTSYHLNLIGGRSNTEVRRNFFTNRVVSIWNALPDSVKESPNVNVFKNRLEKITL